MATVQPVHQELDQEVLDAAATGGPAGSSPTAAAEPPAAQVEAYLGDAWTVGGRFAIPDAVTSDEAERMPWPAVTELRRWGLPAFLVPVADGGRLRSAEELLGLFRVLARRDMRPVIAYGSTFLGALPVWLWGSPEQRAFTAGRILAGDFGSCAISEPAHGSDLAGNECRARRDGDGFLLTGTKWPIGNATRGSFVTVLAGTAPGAQSMLLVDKSTVDPAGWRNLPVAATVGLRGHDLSGLVFTDCPVPADALLGRESGGISQTLRTLQVTRTLIAGLSLGSLDTGLRIALDYAHRRRLYGGPIAELPIVGDILLRAWLDLLIGECVALPVARALSVAPGRMSLWSSVVKYLVPVLAEEALAGLATVLSARQFIREEVAERAFQKLTRDHAVASVFEGTTHVNLSAVASQLPAVLEATGAGQPNWATGAAGPGPATGVGGAAVDPDPVLRVIFDRLEPAPQWYPDGDALRLTSDGQDEIVAGWPAALRQVGELAAADLPEVAGELAGLLARWEGIRASCHGELLTLAAGHRERQLPVRAFTLARTHALWHAAAACLQTWLVNRDRLGGWFADGEWLLLCLHRLAQRLDSRLELAEPYRDRVGDQLRRQYEEGVLFSLTPIALDGR